MVSHPVLYVPVQELQETIEDFSPPVAFVPTGSQALITWCSCCAGGQAARLMQQMMQSSLATHLGKEMLMVSQSCTCIPCLPQDCVQDAHQGRAGA